MPLVPLNLNTLWNYQEIFDLPGEYDCVKAYFSGHYHDGYYQQTGGVHYVTFKAMLDTPDQSAFALVALTTDEIKSTVLAGKSAGLSRTERQPYLHHQGDIFSHGSKPLCKRSRTNL